MLEIPENLLPEMQADRELLAAYLPSDEPCGNELRETLELFVSSMDHATNRRIATHAFFAALNVGSFALYAQLLNVQAASGRLVLLVVATGALTACNVLWHLISKEHNLVARTKRFVITAIESHLTHRAFSAQYLLVRGKGLSDLEGLIPVALAFIHFALLVGLLVRG